MGAPVGLASSKRSIHGAVVLAREAVYWDEYPAGVLLVVWGP